MADIITTNPVRFGSVVWTVVVSSADAPTDVDDIPQEDALAGSIIFKPSSPITVFPLAVPKYTRALADRTVNILDAQVDEQGRKYIKLEANVADAKPAILTWTATFFITYNTVPIPIPPVTFSLLPDEIIDLTDYINPLGPSVWPGMSVSEVQQVLERWAADHPVMLDPEQMEQISDDVSDQVNEDLEPPVNLVILFENSLA